MGGIPHPEWKLAMPQTLWLELFSVVLHGKPTLGPCCAFHVSELEKVT